MKLPDVPARGPGSGRGRTSGQGASGIHRGEIPGLCEVPESGVAYSIELSEDYGSAVVPMGCAASPNDDEGTVDVQSTRVLEDEDRTRRFAWAEVSVMQGGDLFIHEPEVNDDWRLDFNGNWIQ